MINYKQALMNYKQALTEMKAKNPYLSVIIPVYNETGRLKNIWTIFNYLSSQKFFSELIIVDDGSTDNTLQKLKKKSKQIPMKIISYYPNRGKGFAIKQGVLKASGRYILFTDIDLSTPVEEFEKFKKYLPKNDVLLATRKHTGAILLRRQSFLRESLGKGFTLLSQLVLRVSISDFTCGFKCFSKIAAKQIFKKQRIDRWGFDAEVLFLAKKLGFKIKEVPVTWSNDPKTRVKFPQDIINSLIDLYKIRYYNFKKMYE